MDDTSRVDVFQSTLCKSANGVEQGRFTTHKDLVQEVLDKLLLERPGGEKAVEIGTEQLSDEVSIRIGMASVKCFEYAYMSSRGEMKMSLRLMTYHCASEPTSNAEGKYCMSSHIFVPQMLQELEFSVGTLGQDGGAKRLHNLFDGHGLASELIFCRAVICQYSHKRAGEKKLNTYHTRPNAPMPTGCRSVYLCVG